MGGMGKTTVAKAIFKKYQDKFEGKSFLQNVREMKLVKLQEQLLFDILKPANTRVSCVDEGIHEIKRRFHNRRVLVIVDDIDHMKQFEALAIKYESFGLGSRIIITTRDQHLLKILKVDMIYKLPAMNREEAFQLLSWHAFRKNSPDKEYLQVSRKVVDYCGGLPLALEVLGSYLFERSTSEWKSALEKLKFHPHPEILKSLKISFDKLHDYELKSIFLDVSCFFTGMSKDYVMKILDGCDLYPEIGITVLQERCLVTVDHNLKLVMHDLLRDMGREIVRSESSEPGERSRLWHHDDVIDVLRNESGTEAIQGLTLDLQESDKASFSTEAFRNMQSLRLLKLNYVNLTGSYDSLSNELRWLCWHGFPLEVIPKDFDHPNMVAIDLSYSKLIRVWEDSDLLLEKLKFLNLSHSHYLTQSPDFSKLPNLEQLILQDCKCLLHIDQSIGQLQKLVLVDLKDCKALRDLPESFYELTSLETLDLAGCSKFENLAEDLGEMASLTTLILDNTAMISIPPSISRPKNLKSLSFCGLNRPRSTYPLPPLLARLLNLRELYLDGCNLTDVSWVKTVEFAGCSKFENLAEDLGEMSWLTTPTAIKSVPTSVCRLTKLKSLFVYGFKWPLSRLPRSLSVFNTLRAVSLAGCSLTDDAIPMGFLRLNFLEHLDLQRNGFRSLPSFSGISKLQSLSLAGCSVLRAMPEVPKNLKILNLSWCFALEGSPVLSALPSLRNLGKLYLDGCNLTDVTTSMSGLGKLQSLSVYGFKWPLSRLPRSLSVFNTLREVCLAGCNLTDDAIPMEFWRLNFLEHLDLERNSFRSLPSFSGISKLQSLSLAGCSGLRAMPEVPKNLKILNLSRCFALEGSLVLSAMSSLRELPGYHSPNFTEIPVLHNSLKSLTVIHMEGR
ncbi:hypothetical protein C1H46_032648 [Malus baccata]|uniref:Uncharacterized protein n=1 Tax=Malus baccata TaxID=106549 RepID=A0A540L5M2_MALBA|nr:hypothetical protein C1H46_032648 [Malus baccata]